MKTNKKTRNELAKMEPLKIYGVFKCEKCGKIFEEPLNFYVRKHMKYGTISVTAVISRKPICPKCLIKEIKRLKEKSQ